MHTSSPEDKFSPSSTTSTFHVWTKNAPISHHVVHMIILLYYNLIMHIKFTTYTRPRSHANKPAVPHLHLTQLRLLLWASMAAGPGGQVPEGSSDLQQRSKVHSPRGKTQQGLKLSSVRRTMTHRMKGVFQQQIWWATMGRDFNWGHQGFQQMRNKHIITGIIRVYQGSKMFEAITRPSLQ